MTTTLLSNTTFWYATNIPVSGIISKSGALRSGAPQFNSSFCLAIVVSLGDLKKRKKSDSIMRQSESVSQPRETGGGCLKHPVFIPWAYI